MKHFLSAIMLLPLFGLSQNKVNVEKVEFSTIDFYVAGSVPVAKAQYFRLVEGSPYFRDLWTEAILQSAHAKLYKMDKVKLDLVTNDISFIDKDDVERISMVDIKALQFNVPDTNASCRFLKLPLSEGSKKEEWFIELVKNERISLYKRIVKQVSESMPYGTSTLQQRIRDQQKFYLFINSNLIHVKSVSELPAMLPDKKQEMQSFISRLDKKIRIEEKFRMAIEYYILTTTPERDM